MIITVSIFDGLSISDYSQSTLIPGNQTRNWQQRWNLLQTELPLIIGSHTEPLSRETIHAAKQQFFSFLISAYHMKDYLIVAVSEIGLIHRDIEHAITSDPRLALLADLANLVKHGQLSRSPRSGIVPIIDEVSGSDTTAGSGWRLCVRIHHGTSILDGLTIAEDAITAWREKLTAWQIA